MPTLHFARDFEKSVTPLNNVTFEEIPDLARKALAICDHAFSLGQRIPKKRICTGHTPCAYPFLGVFHVGAVSNYLMPTG